MHDTLVGHDTHDTLESLETDRQNRPESLLHDTPESQPHTRHTRVFRDRHTALLHDTLVLHDTLESLETDRQNRPESLFTRVGVSYRRTKKNRHSTTDKKE